MRRAKTLLCLFVIAACGEKAPIRDSLSDLKPEDIRSGYTFLQPDTQALQDDDFSNPGLLWVDRGQELFHAGDKPCSSCHEANDAEIANAAASYPALDKETGQLLNLESRINTCRVKHQSLEPLAYESEALLSLTTYLSSLSRGAPKSVDRSPETQPFYELGEAYFFTRRGQFNMSCAGCHNESWGKQLRGDTISQGHSNGFPAYRLEWQGLGSLHRRLSDCDAGVRAEPMPMGSETYTALEYYLAVRSKNLPLEAPGVRR